MSPLSGAPLNLHATSLVIDGQGLLIKGASGSGKSTLAIELIGLGATLISDDLTVIRSGSDGWPILTGPGRQTGVIEARGVGLLRVPHAAQAPLALIVDLDTPEPERLPQHHEEVILGEKITCLHRVDTPAFAASIRLMMVGGRVE